MKSKIILKQKKEKKIKEDKIEKINIIKIEIANKNKFIIEI